MIHTENHTAQVTREEKIVLALDQAHKNVSDALGDFYALCRKGDIKFFEHQTTGEQLRSILRELETVGNRFDKQILREIETVDKQPSEGG